MVICYGKKWAEKGAQVFEIKEQPAQMCLGWNPRCNWGRALNANVSG